MNIEDDHCHCAISAGSVDTFCFGTFAASVVAKAKKRVEGPRSSGYVSDLRGLGLRTC